MSRNVRKAPATSKRPPKRRDSDSSSSLDLSDDLGYSGVEDISDSSDDDEEDVDAVEEESILKEKETSGTPRPTEHYDNTNDNDNDNEQEEEDVAEADDGDESTSWAGIVSEVDESQTSDFLGPEITERHVHFDVPWSDSDSTATEDNHDDIFPDIFVDQHSLDPAFRREIEDDAEDSSGSGSYWDYRGAYEQFEPEDESVLFTTGGAAADDTPRAASGDHQMSTVDWNVPASEPADDGYESESCSKA